MKNFLRLVLLSIVACLAFCACGSDGAEVDLWETAIHSEDVQLGSGGNTVLVDVVAQDKTVTFTLQTDKTVLEDALTEHNLISGEQGPYGMYVKSVNGIVADYDQNKAYWSLSKSGEYMTTGVSDTQIADGEHYEFTYTK